MKKTILSLTTVVLVLALTVPLLAAPSSVEILLNNYIREQATKQADLLLPRGRYTLQVNVTPDAERIKAESDSGPAIKLPMGSTYLTGSDLKPSMTGDSVEKLLTYIKKIDLKISVMPNVAPSVRDMVKSSLTSALSLDAARGDVVTVDDLPQGFAMAWSPSTDFSLDSSAYFKPVLMLGGMIGIMLIFAAMVLFLAFRQIGTRISSEARNISTTLKDALENQAGPVPSLALPAARGPEAAYGGGGEGAGRASETITGPAFWEKVDLDAVVAFCHDCFEHPHYGAAANALINSILPPDKSAELEKKLPAKTLERYMGTKVDIKPAEITGIFQTNQAEYRRSVRSPIGRTVLTISVPRLLPFTNSLEKMEAAVLVNSLTPLRRGLLLKVLPTSFKMELAKASSKQVSAVEQKAYELSLTEKLTKLAKTEEKEADTYSMDYLSQIIMRAESFEEDEQYYDHAKTSGEAYATALAALDVFTSDDWDAMNLQDLAAAYCGYSPKTKDALVSKFTGKRMDWLKNFLGKLGANPPPYDSPAVQAVHEAIRARVAAKTEVKSKADEPQTKAA
ncbi:MAG: hypothetical protein HYW49_04735 [Deltaproteobacteria bacterium]|nr:hypothetical protein [Deltaproteobacteria bacterium]